MANRKVGTKATQAITSIRDIIDLMDDELLVIEDEVDPIYEVSGIQKALDGSHPLLFENIKGYPGVRNVGNLFSRVDHVIRFLGLNNKADLKIKCLEAIRNPIPPIHVESAPCQEVVIAENISVPDILPLIKHAPQDAGRILGGGIFFVTGKYANGGTEISYKRTHFRGSDWASVMYGLTTHTEKMFGSEFRGQKVPMTINICPPPAVMMSAATAYVHSIVPYGSDEIGIAGGLQGSPIEIIKAKSVDAFSIANSEWVIEGYLDTGKVVWETDEGEKTGQRDEAPFFPEWSGILGREHRGFQFNVTTITHRKDKPIFNTPLAKSFDLDIMSSPLREACFFELADRTTPGLVKDIHIMPGIASWGGSLFLQIKKRRSRDDGAVRDLLMACFYSYPGLQLVLAVDEDIDIHSAEDILWAITMRSDPDTRIFGNAAMRGFGNVFTDVLAPGGGMAIDATVLFRLKEKLQRSYYPSDTVDLKRWIPEDKIAAAQGLQTNYARLLSRTGY